MTWPPRGTGTFAAGRRGARRENRRFAPGGRRCLASNAHPASSRWRAAGTASRGSQIPFWRGAGDHQLVRVVCVGGGGVAVAANFGRPGRADDLRARARDLAHGARIRSRRVRGGLRRRAQRGPARAGCAVRRPGVRDPHHARRRATEGCTHRLRLGRGQFRRRQPAHPVRRRLPPVDHLGPPTRQRAGDGELDAVLTDWCGPALPAPIPLSTGLP